MSLPKGTLAILTLERRFALVVVQIDPFGELFAAIGAFDQSGILVGVANRGVDVESAQIGESPRAYRASRAPTFIKSLNN